jgi:hypothetical protein
MTIRLRSLQCTFKNSKERRPTTPETSSYPFSSSSSHPFMSFSGAFSFPVSTDGTEQAIKQKKINIQRKTFFKAISLVSSQSSNSDSHDNLNLLYT